MNYNIWSLVGLAVLLPRVGMAAPQPIIDRNKVEQGVVVNNDYSYLAIMNPSHNDGKFGARDFRIMPLTRSDKSRTLDENEAMFRFIVRPDCRVFATVGRNRRPVPDGGEWKLKASGATGVELQQMFGPADKGVNVVVALALEPSRSVLNGTVRLSNHGDKEYDVDFFLTFYTLIQELRPLQLVLPRYIVRYQIGGPVKFWRNELTALDNDYQKYWWRKVAENSKPSYIQNLYREKIEFNHPRIQPPSSFGLMGLRGNVAMIFERGGGEAISDLEMCWQKDIAQATPAWRLTLKPGEEREVRFRLLMVRGLERYDNIEGDWVFSYMPGDDALRVVSVPLKPSNRVSVNVNLNDQRGTSLINQRSEMAAANPFSPGRLAYRTTIPFVAGERYPIKLQLNAVRDNARLLDVSGEVTP